MTPPEPLRITHVLRWPLLGGSELETLSIVRELHEFRHRVLFPSRFRGVEGFEIRDRFEDACETLEVERLEDHWDKDTDLVHLQFPFLLVDHEPAEPTVLELNRLPESPTLFTVHAAVNVPVVPDIDYLFHTDELVGQFSDRLDADRLHIVPSLVPLPPQRRTSRRGSPSGSVEILWVTRNEDGKFHPETAEILTAVCAADPRVHFTIVGRPDYIDLPNHPQITLLDCPAPDLDALWRGADLFWYFPHPLLHETWCRTVTESMAHGLPAVVAAHGAMRFQVVNGESGRVVDTPEACIAALLELSADAALRRRFGAAARWRATSFFERTREDLLRTYRAVSARQA